MYLITACSGQTLRIVPLGEARSRASAFDCLLCLALGSEKSCLILFRKHPKRQWTP